jgi:hypothetical protein
MVVYEYEGIFIILLDSGLVIKGGGLNPRQRRGRGARQIRGWPRSTPPEKERCANGEMGARTVPPKRNRCAVREWRRP